MAHVAFKGHFITLEGGEGAGKSTLVDQLAEILTQRGYEVVKTREPGGSDLGKKIRQWLLNQEEGPPLSHRAELLLFLAARAQHIKELILPALEAGKIVLCDRFNDSTISYQGVARGLDVKEVQHLCHFVCGPVLPQLTLFLNVTPEIGLARTRQAVKEEAARGEVDRIEAEKLDFHLKVQQAFERLAKREPFRIYTINADQSQAQVLQEALRALEELVLLPTSKGNKK